MHNTDLILKAFDGKIPEAPKRFIELFGSVDSAAESIIAYIESSPEISWDVMGSISPIVKMMGETFKPFEKRLLAVLNAEEVGTDRYMTALAAVFHLGAGLEFFSNLDAYARCICARPWVIPMVKYCAEGDGFAVRALAALMRATPAEHRADLFDTIEDVRRKVGGSVGVVHKHIFPTYWRGLSQHVRSRWGLEESIDDDGYFIQAH